MAVKVVPLINLDATYADMRCERERYYWETLTKTDDSPMVPLTTDQAQELLSGCDSDFPTPSHSLLESVITQRAYRENEIHLALQMLEQADPDDTEAKTNVLDLVFPRNFTSCDVNGPQECFYFGRCFRSA